MTRKVMTALVSDSGVGSVGTLVEFMTAAGIRREAIRLFGFGAFVRVSYTNHGALVRTHTWYPVMALNESCCDFTFEGSYQP